MKRKGSITKIMTVLAPLSFGGAVLLQSCGTGGGSGNSSTTGSSTVDPSQTGSGSQYSNTTTTNYTVNITGSEWTGSVTNSSNQVDLTESGGARLKATIKSISSGSGAGLTQLVPTSSSGGATTKTVNALSVPLASGSNFYVSSAMMDSETSGLLIGGNLACPTTPTRTTTTTYNYLAIQLGSSGAPTSSSLSYVGQVTETVSTTGTVAYTFTSGYNLKSGTNSVLPTALSSSAYTANNVSATACASGLLSASGGAKVKFLKMGWRIFKKSDVTYVLVPSVAIPNADLNSTNAGLSFRNVGGAAPISLQSNAGNGTTASTTNTMPFSFLDPTTLSKTSVGGTITVAATANVMKTAAGASVSMPGLVQGVMNFGTSGTVDSFMLLASKLTDENGKSRVFKIGVGADPLNAGNNVTIVTVN